MPTHSHPHTHAKTATHTHSHPRRKWRRVLIGVLVFFAFAGVAAGAYWVVAPWIPHGSLRQGLDFEKSVFALVGEDGKVTILEKPEFERGDIVHFALMKVGRFKRGADGKCWIDMDYKVRQGRKLIFRRDQVLGENRREDFKDDTAESPTGIFPPTGSLQPGEYTFELNVYDREGGGHARDVGTFTIVNSKESQDSSESLKEVQKAVTSDNVGTK